MSRAIVVGGGVIGLSCAYQIARRGMQVTVIESGEPGGGCSSGNLGWIAPSLSEPLPSPGLTWKSLRWMLYRDSPLYIDPRFAVRSVVWLWRFWRHCNARDFHHGLEAVGDLHRHTLALYDAFRADGVRFELHRDGLLFVFLAAPQLERSLAGFEAVRAPGRPAPLRLDRAGLLALQPGLAERVIGGILIPDEAHARPETVCAGLVRRLGELGVDVLSRTEVLGVMQRGGRVFAVETSSGMLEGDSFVLAAGAGSGRLARRFGFSLPIEAGKGYTVTMTQPDCRPVRPTYLYEMRVGISPFDGALRLGGTMELSGFNSRINPGRVAAIRRAAGRYLPGSERGATGLEWTGMRPLTPDGLPVIGRAPGFDNLLVATGHAMHGVGLAPVTGLAIAELVGGTKSSFDLRPFDPARFGR